MTVFGNIRYHTINILLLNIFFSKGPTDCIDGRNYNGNLSISATGRRCLMWSSHSDMYPLSTFGVSSWDEVLNYCR